MSDDKHKKGFSGLSSLASDLDEIVRVSTHRDVQGKSLVSEGGANDEGQPHPRGSAPEPQAAPPLQSEPEVVASSTSRTPTSGTSGVTWIWRLIGVGVLIPFLWLSNGQQEDSARSSSLRTSTELNSSPSSPTYTPRPSTQTRRAELEFSKPPVGQNNVLSVAQIRWCVREGLRIKALRPMVTTNAQIGQFNAVVSDYHSRCGRYRYLVER